MEIAEIGLTCGFCFNPESNSVYNSDAPVNRLRAARAGLSNRTIDGCIALSGVKDHEGQR